MNDGTKENLQVVLAKRPKGVPAPDCFDCKTVPIPEPGEGKVLLRTELLSLDPYMRGRMTEGASYADTVPLGGVMVGQTVSRVVKSRNENFAEGERVIANAGWQAWSVSDGRGLLRVAPDIEDVSLALGALGMPGFTAYVGLLDIGRPRAGETLVVSAATGGVGAIAGQIGKMTGCRVVGVAGSDEKCRHACVRFGFDACVNRLAEDFPERLRKACPDGIDIYFENVGGAVFDTVFPLLRTGARIPVCGLIAHYNTGFYSPGPDRLPRLMADLVIRRIRLQGFLILDHYESGYEEFSQAMGEWLRTGRVRYRNDFVDRLEAAPEAFIGLFQGRNFGKLIVRVDGR